MGMAKEKDEFVNDLEERFLDDVDELAELEGLEVEDAAEETPAIAALQSEVADLKDKLLRALAETENLRKRAERDRRDAELYGGVRLARDLLSVHDNLGRALDAMDDTLREQAKGVAEGIELTQKDLLAVFQKHKIEKLEPQIGDRFDPKLHQAMFEAPIGGQPAGAIIQVVATGFVIGDRLLRPAQVGVSSGGGAAPAEA